MKKLIVLLLALAMVGAVSAQVTTAVGLYGEVTLVDEAGQGKFTPWGDAYDTLTLRAQDKDGKYGFSLTDQNLLDGNFDTLRDWTVWGKVLDGRLSFGNLRDATFRLTLPFWASYTIFGGTDRVSGNGLFYVYGPKDGVTLGVNLPYRTTAAATLDVLKNLDLGVKYDVKDFGTLFALANLDMDSVPNNILNAGVRYTGVKALTVTAITKLQFDANTYRGALGLGYTGIAKLAANFESAVVSTAGVITYSVWGQGKYAVADKVSATLGAFYGNAGYDVYAALGYDLGAGMSTDLKVGFDNAVYAVAKVYYALSL